MLLNLALPSYGTLWYPKIQTAWSNLGCWFWCNYILYTFVRSLNLIYAFCPPILGDEQHFGAATELSQVDKASGCSICEDDCDTIWCDRVWKSMCLMWYHISWQRRVRIARLSMKTYGWGTRPAWAMLQLDEHFWQCNKIGCENTNRFKEYEREVCKSGHLLPALVWSLQNGFGQVSWD